MPRRVISTSGSSGIGNFAREESVIVVAGRREGASRTAEAAPAMGDFVVVAPGKYT